MKKIIIVPYTTILLKLNPITLGYGVWRTGYMDMKFGFLIITLHELMLEKIFGEIYASGKNSIVAYELVFGVQF